MESNISVNIDRLWSSLSDMAKIGPGIAGGNNRQTVTVEDGEARRLARASKYAWHTPKDGRMSILVLLFKASKNSFLLDQSIKGREFVLQAKTATFHNFAKVCSIAVDSQRNRAAHSSAR